MNGRARIAAFRNSVVVAIALLVLIPATSRSEFAQDPQQKTATSGLGGVGPVVQGTPDDPLRDPHETHLRHVKQLTFGGQNAEAYFSYDGKRLIFMSTREPYQMRSDFHHEHRWLECSSALDRQRPHHLRIFLSRRPARALFFDASRRRRLPSAPGLFAWVRLGGLFVVSDVLRDR